MSCALRRPRAQRRPCTCRRCRGCKLGDAGAEVLQRALAFNAGLESLELPGVCRAARVCGPPPWAQAGPLPADQARARAELRLVGAAAGNGITNLGALYLANALRTYNHTLTALVLDGACAAALLAKDHSERFALVPATPALGGGSGDRGAQLADRAASISPGCRLVVSTSPTCRCCSRCRCPPRTDNPCLVDTAVMSEIAGFLARNTRETATAVAAPPPRLSRSPFKVRAACAARGAAAPAPHWARDR